MDRISKGRIWVRPGTTLPYDGGWITVSRRYEVIGGRYGNQLDRITFYYCGRWVWAWIFGWLCSGERRTATFALTSASQPDPLHIYLDRAAFDGTVSYVNRTGTDRDGRPVTWQELQANPIIIPRTYTIRETWRCISGSCP